MKGIELAKDNLDEEMKNKINIIYEDTQSKANLAVDATNKLINLNNVKLIIGPIRSDNTLAVAPFVEKNKIILMSPVATSEKISLAGDYIFRNRENGALHSQKFSEFLIQKNLKEVNLFVAQSSNAQTYAKTFIDSFETLGGKIIIRLDYQPAQTDFRTELTKLVHNKPSTIFLAPTTGRDAGLIVKQLRELKWNGLIICVSMFPETTDFKNSVQNYEEGIIYSAPKIPVTEQFTHFIKKYKEKYGSTPDFLSANGYDAFMIFVQAIEQCNQDTNCIKNYLYNLQNYTGVGGITSFDKNGDVQKEVEIKIIKQGQFVKYDLE